MRRSALAVLAVTLAAAAVLAVGSGREGRDPLPHHGSRADPRHAARQAHDLALAQPLVLTLVTGDGHEVARAVVGDRRVELAAAGLSGVQEGDRLSALGTTVEAPAVDRARLLAPLVDRPARWEGRHLRLDGSPPAQAWLDVEGRLARLELDLGGSRLVVTPAP